jgi:hypothetical protein
MEAAIKSSIFSLARERRGKILRRLTRNYQSTRRQKKKKKKKKKGSLFYSLSFVI